MAQQTGVGSASGAALRGPAPEGVTGGAAQKATSGGDSLGTLERLAALRASGALTEEEFQEQKRKILGPA